MLDDKPSQSVQQQSVAQPLTVPPSENRPSGLNAAEVREEGDENRIANLEDRMRSAEKVMAWLTLAIAVFALCSVIVALLQWWVMRGQLKEMHDGGADTHTLAKQAIDQTLLLRQQVVGTMSSSFVLNGPELVSDKVRIGWNKTGQVISPEFHATFRIS